MHQCINGIKTIKQEDGVAGSGGGLTASGKSAQETSLRSSDIWTKTWRMKRKIARTRKKLFQAEEREQDAWKLGAFKDQKETTGVKLLWRDGELGMRGLRSHMGRSWKDDRPWKRKLGFYFQPNRTFGGFQPGESCDGIDVFQGDSGCSVKNGLFDRQGRSLGDQ